MKKTVERAHTPAKMWEKIRLDSNFEKAIGQIEKELEHWPMFLQAKCKLRLAKTLEYLRRMRKIAKDEVNQPVLTVKAKKVVKREASREARAKKVAQLENVIERELVERLQKGVYGDIYNLPQNVFESVLQKQGQAETMDETAIEEELDEDEEIEYVEEDEYEEEEEEEEEFEEEREYLEEFEASQDESELVEDVEDIVAKPKKRKQYVEIEYETEDQQPTNTNRR